jgi:ELWxxDGT repeat protein
LTVVGNQAFFLTNNGAGGSLWRIDGTSNGTYMITGSDPVGTPLTFQAPLIRLGNVLFVAASDPNGGTELWRTDGTQAGTVRVKDIAPGAASSNPQSFFSDGGTLYFLADAGDGRGALP